MALLHERGNVVGIALATACAKGQRCRTHLRTSLKVLGAGATLLLLSGCGGNASTHSGTSSLAAAGKPVITPARAQKMSVDTVTASSRRWAPGT